MRWTLCATDRCFRSAALAPFFRAAKVGAGRAAAARGRACCSTGLLPSGVAGVQWPWRTGGAYVPRPACWQGRCACLSRHPGSRPHLAVTHTHTHTHTSWPAGAACGARRGAGPVWDAAGAGVGAACGEGEGLLPACLSLTWIPCRPARPCCICSAISTSYLPRCHDPRPAPLLVPAVSAAGGAVGACLPGGNTQPGRPHAARQVRRWGATCAAPCVLSSLTPGPGLCALPSPREGSLPLPPQPAACARQLPPLPAHAPPPSTPPGPAAGRAWAGWWPLPWRPAASLPLCCPLCTAAWRRSCPRGAPCPSWVGAGCRGGQVQAVRCWRAQTAALRPRRRPVATRLRGSPQTAPALCVRLRL